MGRVFNACLCALMFIGGALVQGHGVALAAEEQQSITLVSGGSGAPGSPDPLVTVSLDERTFQPAVITTPHPAYDTIAGTQWITVDGSANATARYRLPFTLPAGAVGPSLVVDLHADNYAEVILNGTSLGAQSSSGDVGNFQNPPEQFSTDSAAQFVVGENHLDILVTDQAPPAGLDVSAVVRYTPEGGPTPTPPTVSIADVEVDEGDSGAPTADLTVSIDPPSTAPSSVTVATANGTAGRRDYGVRDPYVLAFDANQTAATVSIPIVPDTALEPDETFSVVLSAPTGGLVLGDATGVVTIVDDDPLTLSIGDASGPEGGNVDLPIAFSSPALESGSVLASTNNDSASAPADFAPALGRMIAWEAGATKAKVRIAAANDDLIEGPETFSVSLSDPDGATIEGGSATGTIVDGDDVPPPQPIVSVSNATATEGDPGAGGVLHFGVSIQARQKANVNVSIETRPNTANGSDYHSQRQTVTIPAGLLNATLSVPVVGDLVPEGQEKMSVYIVGGALSGVGPVAFGQRDGIGTINDDDPAQPKVSVSNATSTEGDPGSAGVLRFGVSIQTRQKANVNVSIETRAFTAGGSDYVGGTRTVTIPAGTLSATVSVPLIGDLVPEGEEKMIVYIVGGALSGVGPVTFERREGFGTIKDDDSLPTVSIFDGQGAEGTEFDGTAQFVVRLDHAGVAPVEVDFATVLNGKIAGAASGSDLTMISGTVTFAPGETERIINVTLHADSLIEVDEHFTVQLTGVRGGKFGDKTATGLIGNDDGSGPETAT